ncbi:hypothetical protein Nepgr_012179 [Nepenthes gracilis]|uniref:RINT1-like protein MAG2L n=1 Tax=Nepenthes gracilis TaxID=150966 RepID=A0AAD3SFH1_NEPGR|nr:hypothetical protein Nepgr_012179 [Nepenthes gracilis]
MERDVVLPRRSDLSAQTLGFLEQQFKSNEDLIRVSDLVTELNIKSFELKSDLQNMQRKLGSLLVSWTSRSIQAKASFQDLIGAVENLSLLTSEYGSNACDARKIQKITNKELPLFAKELRRIASLREYAETALKLEALVGDLEDAVFCVMKHRTGDLFSRNSLTPLTPGVIIHSDFDAKQGRTLQAVKIINGIEDILLSVMKLHPQWCHLLKTVDSRVYKILAVLRPQVIVDHRSLLSSLGWTPKVFSSRIGSGENTGIPNPLVLMQGDKRESYSQSFLALSALQHVQMRREERQLNILGRKKEDNFGLWGIDELVSPIASRIEYHLLKWISQPEFIFALVYKVTHDFIEGVDDVLQPLIDKARLISYSAREAWVSAMVKMLSTFLSKRVFLSLAELYKEKHSKAEAISSWIRLVDLIVAFDKRMQSLISSDAYLLLGESGTFIGPSTTISVLSLFRDRPDWLHIWQKIELKDALKKLKAELKHNTAWVTDEKHEAGQFLDGEPELYLLTTRGDHKAPLIVEFALKIAWEMIERYQNLPAGSHRIHFIRSTASKFLWHFVNVLLMKHERNDFPSNDSDEALMTVCALINAARFCEFKLQTWSDDVLLLGLGIAENGMNSDINGHMMETSCFFDEEIKSFSELEMSWLMEMIAHILRQFETLSFEYFHNLHRLDSLLKDVDRLPAMNAILSDDLVEALDNLRSQLLLLRQHLNPKDFLDLWRSVADGLDHFIFHSILTSDIRLPDGGAKQFIADMQGLFLLFQTFCARPEAFFPFISDFLKLLNLDIEEIMALNSCLLDNEKGTKCLLSHGILHISTDQSHTVLSNRMSILKK